MQFDKRDSGISLIGELEWGSHFCQFYQTRNDILDILLPFFRTGIEKNELCMWVIQDSIDTADILAELTGADSFFAKAAKEGKLRIIPIAGWLAGRHGMDSAVVPWLDDAIMNGFDGLRLACEPAAEGDDDCLDSADELQVISRLNVLANFLYPHDSYDAPGLMEIVRNHAFALVRNAGAWEIVESSEAKVIRHALKRSEEKLQSLFSNMSEGFSYNRIVVDKAGEPRDYIMLDVNYAFEHLTGLRREDIIGRRVTEVLPGIESDPADFIGRFGRVAVTGKPDRFESYSVQLDRWYSCSAFCPHKGFFAVTFSEITERKLAEEELRKALARLEQSNSDLQQFAYVASHDLQEPLRMVSSYVQLLERRYGDKLDADAVDFINFAADGAERMRGMIQDLLAYSRVGTQGDRLTRVDFEQVLSDALANLQVTISECGAEVTHTSLPEVSGDPSQLTQLMQNLIGNAIKFRGDDPPRVTVQAEAKNGEWFFSVKDNGIGIEPEYAERIFDIFQRLHNRLEYPGTGIGLAICKKIVDRHGGRIWAEARAGGGSIFRFTIPGGDT
ncbi:MAG: MEDS domain-containing protein [Thermoleophilia bacterium]|nr:MEDS domain-containing protein [Thermoleophilia bacterium]